MGPTEIDGLPAHILLVHLVVVLVPVTAVLVLVAGVWPAARRWLNWLPPLFALGALITVPITTHAGHWLEDHLAGTITPAIRHHVALGEQMLPWTIALFAGSLAVWLLARAEGLRSIAIGHRGNRNGHAAPGTSWRRHGLFGRRAVRLAVALIAIVVAAGATQQVYRTGEAGSRAVWSGSFRS